MTAGGKGLVVRSPLRCDCDAQELRLPVRLVPSGQDQAPKQDDLIVYVLHHSRRFEASNNHSVLIPTNIGWTEDRNHMRGTRSLLASALLAMAALDGASSVSAGTSVPLRTLGLPDAPLGIDLPPAPLGIDLPPAPPRQGGGWLVQYGPGTRQRKRRKYARMVTRRR